MQEKNSIKEVPPQKKPCLRSTRSGASGNHLNNLLGVVREQEVLKGIPVCLGVKNQQFIWNVLSNGRNKTLRGRWKVSILNTYRRRDEDISTHRIPEYQNARTVSSIQYLLRNTSDQHLPAVVHVSADTHGAKIMVLLLMQHHPCACGNINMHEVSEWYFSCLPLTSCGWH